MDVSPHGAERRCPSRDEDPVDDGLGSGCAVDIGVGGSAFVRGMLLVSSRAIDRPE